MKAIAFLLTVLLANSFIRIAIAADTPDTYGNRLAAARSYLEIMPMKDMMRNMAAESAKNLPKNIRPSYIQYMTKTVRVEVLESASLASMAKHFTVRELKALTAFYGSPEGRSAIKKFGIYMADVTPVIQQEMLRAQQQLEYQSLQHR